MVPGDGWGNSGSSTGSGTETDTGNVDSVEHGDVWQMCSESWSMLPLREMMSGSNSGLSFLLAALGGRRALDSHASAPVLSSSGGSVAHRK